MAKQQSVVRGSKLETYDWTHSTEPPNHPVPVILRTDTIFTNENGNPEEVVATAAEGFRFYWAHGHIHVEQISGR